MLYLVLYLVVRICNEDLTLGEHELAKGSTIMVHMQGVHHNPKFWPEPLLYNPDRFSQINFLSNKT